MSTISAVAYQLSQHDEVMNEQLKGTRDKLVAEQFGFTAQSVPPQSHRQMRRRPRGDD